MGGSWGSAKNNIRIGVFWDSVKIDQSAGTGKLVNAVVKIDRGVNIIDSVNNLSWGGSAVGDGSESNINVDGSGVKTIKSCSETTVSLNYGSTKTITFDADFSGIDYAGGTLHAAASYTLPARTYDLPAAPGTPTVSRSSDTQQAVSWAHNGTTSAPYTAQYLERLVDGSSAWVQIATLSGTSTSYNDTSTSANHRYCYRLRAKNSTGYSAYSGVSSWIETTPSAPRIGTPSKSGTTITIPWTNTAPYADSVQLWHAADGVWDGSPLATVSASLTSFTHVNVNTAQTHQYRVRALSTNTVAGTLYSAYSGASAVVQLLVPPGAPSVSVDAQAIDLSTTPLGISWVHNPTDSTDQTAAELRWCAASTEDWVTFTFTTESSFTYPPTAVPYGQYEIQCRTRGDAPEFGPWSESVIVLVSSSPQCLVVLPSDTVENSSINVGWSYFDAAAYPQAEWAITLLDAEGVALSYVEGSGTATTAALPYTLENNTDYTLTVKVKSGAGVWSEPAEHAFAVTYPPAPSPSVDVEWDEHSLATLITCSFDPLEFDDVESVTIWRQEGGQWVRALVYSPTESTQAVTDYIPPLDTEVQYLVASRTHQGVETIGGIHASVQTSSGGRFILNAGSGWSSIAWARALPKLTTSGKSVKALHMFAGRRRPVEYSDLDGGSMSWSLTATIARDAGTPRAAAWSDKETWDAFGFQVAPICARFPGGEKRFVSIGSVTVTADHMPLASLSVVFSETDDREE